MPSNFEVFAAEIDAFKIKLLPEQFKLFRKKLAFELFARVVPRTPVDTGRARGGWQIGLGTIPSGEDGEGIEQELAKLAGLEGDETIYIANPVPYAVFLEEGSSQQAPNGMLAVSIQEVEQIFKSVA